MNANELWNAMNEQGRIVHLTNDIGVSRFGQTIHIFDLTGAEVCLHAPSTTAKRLIAHVNGFLKNQEIFRAN